MPTFPIPRAEASIVAVVVTRDLVKNYGRIEALRQLGIPAVFPPELALAKGLWAN